jgi:hypothetical protein
VSARRTRRLPLSGDRLDLVSGVDAMLDFENRQAGAHMYYI